jgi:hypothetical protein
MTLDGNDLGPLFVTPQHVASPWFVALLIGLAIPGAVLLAFGFVTGRLPRMAAGFGLFAIPILVFVLANACLFESSKDIRFCASCHVMEPIVDAALAGGEELAARHITLGAIPRREACYTCHSNYGLWGTVQAKNAGLGHVVRNAFGWYHFPLELNETYPVSTCLGCHAQSEKFRAQATHSDPATQKALLDGSLGCTGACHAAPHPESVLSGLAGKPR